MKAGLFSIELEGRRVLVDPATQEVCVLDAGGAVISRERIQVAAGSVQGIFSAVRGAADALAPFNAQRNA